MNPKQLFANTTTFLLVVLGLSYPSPQYPKNRYSFLVVFVLRGVCDACLSVTSNNYLFGEKKCVKIALLKAHKVERERGWKMHSKHHDDYMYIIPPRCLTSFNSKKVKVTKCILIVSVPRKIQLIISFGFIHSLHEKLKNAPILPTLIKPLPKTHLTFKMSHY